MNYDEFIQNKSQLSGNFGFKPTFLPDFLFSFQRALLEWSVLKPLGVGVLVNASHSCMSCRGVMKTGTTMTTCALKGVMKKKDVKEEFFLHCYK